MKIEKISIEEIKPYANNAKLHPPEQIEQIKKSIEEFGNNDPIAIDENNTIIEGHGRYEALKQLGFDEAHIIRLTHLNEQQKKAYILVHNKLTMNTGFDFDILNIELDNIIDFNMSDFGFENLNFSDENQQELIEDEIPDIPKEPKSKIGDIYQLGNHRLMCGDSTNCQDAEKLMNGNKADMVFTDPPYGYCYQSNMRINSKKFEILKNDDRILDFFPIIKKFCDGFVFICTTWKVLNKWLPLFEKYYTLSNMIIWNKGGGGIGDLKRTFSTDYEIILCSNDGKKLTGSRLGSVWNIPKNNPTEYVHATQKPIKLAATAIENTTNRNELVLDLFGGSGSTLIACEQTGRTCYMMELDPLYVDVIIERFEKFTGKKAVKIND